MTAAHPLASRQACPGQGVVAAGVGVALAVAVTTNGLVGRLAEALKAAVGSPELQERFKTLGIESAPWSPAEFQEFVARENAAWRPLIRDLGIRLDG